MARIFITGAADGLGQMAAQLLIAEGNQVVLHARNALRATEALAATPGAEMAISGDLSSIKETIALAEKVNKSGLYDAIIHNAGIGYQEPYRNSSIDGLPPLFAVNSLAPYILSSLIPLPQRLIYVSSVLHLQGDASFEDLTWDKKIWNGTQAYSDTKLHNVLLAFAVARHFPHVYSNAMEPGWVPTKMGGSGATDSLVEAPKTQVWLAGSNDDKVFVTGQYFYHQKHREFHPAAANVRIQEDFLMACERISGIKFPIGNP